MDAWRAISSIGMFVRGVIVDDGVNELAAWHGAVHGGEKSDELLMPMLVHATPLWKFGTAGGIIEGAVLKAV